MNTKHAPYIKKAILHGAYVHNLFLAKVPHRRLKIVGYHSLIVAHGNLCKYCKLLPMVMVGK
ncbi:hypothetical protein APHNP_0987 [Anaplasma phagocytophilum str. ApNP]|uniref:Uncharacterized protein n=2 Tax=Anaplasma phagocytophilum TaxID=948 RepID=A0A0F3NIK8_ANAPH|nr:hypothetical protein APHMUC_1186 [Anaplasma phagocytophilum str. ApMUC09]KJV64102.1 hypothetical protein APHMUC_1122 [Anaplasma phagocytophilum str. ApMUC09]KJV67350.1 hypothetical protein APHNP_0917 [Anaplasma phagocytophilum str. ApNP]KJV67903.1 hypothetical protein APHNP_0987 [Anaplasma phagocytophilum str. ApNP]